MERVTVLHAGPDGPIRVSVIVPAYRRVGPLLELLDTLFAQRIESGRFEVVVSDDGSGPEVEAALHSVAAGSPCRLVLVAGPNAGPGVARNRGVAAASGALLAFIDSDCRASHGWLDGLAGALDAGADLAHGPVTSSLPAIEPFVHSFQVGEVPVCGANFATSRRIFDRVGGFRAEISRVAEDHDLVDRIRAAGAVVRYVPHASVEHPPRLKRITVSIRLAESAKAPLRDLASFYRLMPHRRGDIAASNRALGRRAALKIAILAIPFFAAPPWWAIGPGFFVSMAITRWLTTNRRLALAHEPWRVPAVEALRYALFLPFIDLVTLLHRARFGLLFFGSP